MRIRANRLRVQQVAQEAYRLSMVEKRACALAGSAPSAGDAHVCALRASNSIAAAGVRGGAAEVEHVQHVEEKHELEHDEKAEPVNAAVHASELARAARMRERGSRAGKLAVRKSPPHPS